MPNLVPFSFESFNVRVIADEDGEPLFVAKDVADSLEYKDTVNAIKLHCKGVAKYHPLETAGGTQKVRVIREPDLYRLIAGSTLPSAERFEKWLFEEVLPSIRKTGSYHLGPQPAKPDPAKSQLAAKMLIARGARAMLRMSETSTIRMLSKIAESEGIQPDFLPAYANETLTKSITVMLKDMGHDLSRHVSHVVNPALEAMGILERLSRASGRDSTKVKRFWSLTEIGLQYGRNETSPNNPRETQPLYFVDRFPEPLSLLESHLAGTLNRVSQNGQGAR